MRGCGLGGRVGWTERAAHMLSSALMSLLLPKRAARWRGVRPSQWRQRGGAVSTPESRAVTISSTTASCAAERPCEDAETARCSGVRPKLSASSLAPLAMSVLTACTSYRRTASCRRVSCWRARLPVCREAMAQARAKLGTRGTPGVSLKYLVGNSPLHERCCPTCVFNTSSPGLGQGSGRFGWGGEGGGKIWRI